MGLSRVEVELQHQTTTHKGQTHDNNYTFYQPVTSTHDR